MASKSPIARDIGPLINAGQIDKELYHRLCHHPNDQLLGNEFMTSLMGRNSGTTFVIDKAPETILDWNTLIRKHLKVSAAKADTIKIPTTISEEPLKSHPSAIQHLYKLALWFGKVELALDVAQELGVRVIEYVEVSFRRPIKVKRNVDDGSFHVPVDRKNSDIKTIEVVIDQSYRSFFQNNVYRHEICMGSSPFHDLISDNVRFNTAISSALSAAYRPDILTDERMINEMNAQIDEFDQKRLLELLYASFIIWVVPAGTVFEATYGQNTITIARGPRNQLIGNINELHEEEEEDETTTPPTQQDDNTPPA